MANLEGIAQGIKKGIVIGKQQGKQQEKLEIAKNMLSDKLDIAFISKYSGLSVEEIKNLEVK